MPEREGEVIVGILGQWASGKSTAASTLVQYLGGEDEVVFITDRELVAGQALNHILELDAAQVKLTAEEDEMRRLEGELATVYLRPGEDLRTVDLNTLLFDLHDGVYEGVASGSRNWFDRARLELGRRIRQSCAAGKPIVIEAGFGTNMDPRGENPLSHTISDLFARLEEAGVEPERVKWIIVEAGYERRSERNSRRLDDVPPVEFDRFAADGGDLDPDQQRAWQERGASITRVANDHDDIDRFRADIMAAFERMFGSQLQRTKLGGEREP